MPDGEQKTNAAFKAVWKRNMKQQRKFLATLAANYLFGLPPRTRDLSFWGRLTCQRLRSNRQIVLHNS